MNRLARGTLGTRTPYQLVGRQLGHADVQMVARIYGRFSPCSDERDRGEKIAAQLDHAAEKKSAATQKAKKSTKWVPYWVPHFLTIRANHR